MNRKRFAFVLAPMLMAAFAVSAFTPVTQTVQAAEKVNAAPLKIGYSDWPGWLVLEIGKQKGFFPKNVELVWFSDYGASIDAYSAGKLDGIMIACCDSLKEKASTVIVLTDYSNGNDMIIGKPGITDFKSLKGKTVAVEQNLVEHLLLARALEENGMTEADIKLKYVKTETTLQALQAAGVDAVGAWYPISGEILEKVAGAKALFTSAQAPGLIYDALQVDPVSLLNNKADWQEVVKVWFKCLAYLNDPATHDEAVKIMAKRIDGKPADLEKNLKGTFLLDGKGNIKAMQKKNTLASIYGSLENGNKFYLARKVITAPVNVDKMVDPTIVESVVGDGK